LDAGLDAACAKGVDIYYDNVGGPILDTVLGHMNAFSRIPLCGLISGYDDPNALAIKNFRSFLVNRIQLRGFICSDHLDLWKLALKELATLVHEGKLRYRESIAVGLENAPKAFIGLLKGQNFGKQLVKLI
jgi:NADPH-dependent curcumin reductase CurA